MLTIRLANIDDIEEVVALRMAVLLEMQPEAVESEAEVTELTRRYVAEKLPKGEFLVWFAEEDGRVVGTGGLVFYHRPPLLSYHSGLQAYLLNMYTIPEYRCKGVATAVLRQIIDYVKTTSAGRISLHASALGQPLYEKFGFIAASSEMILKL